MCLIRYLMTCCELENVSPPPLSPRLGLVSVLVVYCKQAFIIITMQYRARWNGQILAESSQTISLENNIYFPASDVRHEFLKTSDLQSTCPWKGKAHYYHIQVADQSNPDAAWYYPQPSKLASHIKDYIAFWKGVEVSMVQ